MRYELTDFEWAMAPASSGALWPSAPVTNRSAGDRTND
jgi:hypothetical protein